MIIAGIFFCIASIFRFYIISFVISDVRMAQTICFYGSLFTMFFLLIIFVIVVFNSNNGDASSPAVMPWACLGL